MHRDSIKFAACLVVMGGFLSGDWAAAQAPPTVVGAGLSLMSNEGTATGFAINVSRELTTGSVAIGPAGDFSLNSDNGVTWTTFGGGIRVSGHPTDSPLIPFGQFLAGASVLSGFGTNTYLTFTFGGGLHVPIGERLNVLVQFDLVNARFDGGSETAKRTILGVSVPFGAR